MSPLKNVMLVVVVGLLVAPAVSPAFADKASGEVSKESSRKSAGESEPAQPLEPSSAAKPWKVYWKDSTRIETESGDLKLKLGGRLHADFLSFSSDQELDESFGPIGDDSELRRVRLFVSGSFFERGEFKVQYDFAGDQAQPKDVYVGVTKVPVLGKVLFGHLKEPFSLEGYTSSNYVAFVERSSPVESFAPGRSLGVRVENTFGNDRLTLSAGLFRDVDNGARGFEDGATRTTVRVAGRPLDAREGRRLVHLGAAASFADLGGREARFRARPEAHLTPRFVDTGRLTAGETRLMGLEVAVIEGPFWAQAEWMSARVDSAIFGPRTFSGSYVEVGYFLTGESKPYKRSSAAFDRVRPERPFDPGNSLGAFEVALRHSTLDLNDGEVSGGRLEGLSLALNWYPSSSSRVMVDYQLAETGGGDGDSFGIRLQLTF